MTIGRSAAVVMLTLAATWWPGRAYARQDLAAGDVFVGAARVVDGDTIHIPRALLKREGAEIAIGYVKVRADGIDAIEKSQSCRTEGGETIERCGERVATPPLKRHIGRRWVACRHKEWDRYGRSVATCRVRGQELSLSEWMVGEGWATAYWPIRAPDLSPRPCPRDAAQEVAVLCSRTSEALLAAEAAARAARKGLWRMIWVNPWCYRKSTLAGQMPAVGTPTHTLYLDICPRIGH